MSASMVTGPGILHRFVGVAVDDLTYRRLLYLALAFPLGISYFVLLVITYSLGAGLAVVLVGVPILAAAVGMTIGLVAFERVLTSVLLDVEYEESILPEYDSPSELLYGLVVTRRTPLGLVYLLGQLFVGVAAFVLLFSTAFVAGSFLLTPLYYEGATVGIHLPETIHLAPDVSVGWGGREIELVIPITIGSWIADSLLDALAIAAFGAVLLLASLHVTNAAGRLLARYSRLMLR